MSNLPFSYTEDMISDFANEFGKVKSVELVLQDGRSSGRAFVDFENEFYAK